MFYFGEELQAVNGTDEPVFRAEIDRCREQMYGHQAGKVAGGWVVVGWTGRLGLTCIH